MIFVKMTEGFKEVYGSSTTYTYGGLDINKIKGTFFLSNSETEVAYFVYDGAESDLPPTSESISNAEFDAAYAAKEGETKREQVTIAQLQAEIGALKDANTVLQNTLDELLTRGNR